MQFPIFTSLLRVLFPVRCSGCKTPGTALCTGCLATLPFAQDLPSGTYAIFGYEHPIVRRAIWELKYHRHSELARTIALAGVPRLLEHLGDHLQTLAPQRIVFVPIPTHTKRARDRGFNQSALVATWWKDALPQSSITNALRKVVPTTAQARLSRSARLKNVHGSMQCTSSLDPQKLYIIVDDVITTGATCSEARRTLRAAGARKIYAIALAHGYART